MFLIEETIRHLLENKSDIEARLSEYFEKAAIYERLIRKDMDELLKVDNNIEELKRWYGWK